MIAADTNFLIRILLDDEEQPKQVSVARKLASAAKNIYVPQVVQVEIVWVMKSAYQLKKSVIIKILEHLDNNQAFVLQDADIFHTALIQYIESNADFSDCIILAQAQKFGVTLHTFDKRLAKLSGATTIE
ncbi:PilT-like protein [Beggiatoa sp. PS]|nr:PilT-like protein [Beggiatoa sp. PS]